MIIIGLMQRWLFGNAAKASLIAAAIAIALLYDHSRVRTGVQQQIQKQETIDHAAINNGSSAAQRSADAATRGVLDPYTRPAQ